MKLTAKQQVFVEEYLVDMNATAAYRRAGYAAKGNSAEANASRLLRNAKVAVAIQEAMDKRSARTEITADSVLEEIAKMAFANIADLVDWSDGFIRIKPSSCLTSTQTAAITEIAETTTASGGTVKIKMHPKIAALELLGKHLKLFTDKHEITGKDDADILKSLSDAIAKDPDVGIGPSRSRRKIIAGGRFS